jgi:hypothetical protein
VLVIIDNADRLDQDLALTMISNLAERFDGQVMVVVVTRPDSPMAAALSSPDRYALLGRVQNADADPDMGEEARADVAGDMCPWLARATVERIARRTRTFTDVFAVASAGRLADLVGEDSETLAEGDAVRLYRELLPDRIRVLGRDHPDVLTTRGNIAALTE